MAQSWILPRHSLPFLASLSQRLASDNRRMSRAIDRLPTLIQHILAAYYRRDQRSLRELSQKLLAAAGNQPFLASAAGDLARQIDARQVVPVKRALLRLIGHAGAARAVSPFVG